MIIERTTTIARALSAVFDFVADPMNDPIWCPKVRSVRPLNAVPPGPGARYDVVHRPIPLRPARRMEYTMVSWDPPHSIDWLEDDGHDRFEVTYKLSVVDERTKLTQRDDARVGAPRILHPLLRAGIGRDVAAQLERLRTHLERG